jgi:hypothetical protein
MREGAAALSMSLSKLYELADDGRIETVYVDGRRYLTDSALNDFVASASTTRTHRRGKNKTGRK